MEKIPVNIISGFLGAGKTTAIINLMSQKTTDDQWAVVINEFGKISIDSQTLSSATDSENIFEITGGCICCTAKGYLNETLQAVIQSRKYSRIIIEPTGLGGIDMVSEIIEGQPILFLKPILCLVDVNLVQKPKLMMIPIFRAQITKSDIIVFSKTDLISDPLVLSELKKQFVESFPNAHISTIGMNVSLLDYDLLKIEDDRKISKFSYIDPNLSATNYTQKFYTFDSSIIFHSDKLKALFGKHRSVVRAKGYVLTEMGWRLLNMTLTDCIFELCEECEQTEFVIISDKSQQDLYSDLDSEILKATRY